MCTTTRSEATCSTRDTTCQEPNPPTPPCCAAGVMGENSPQLPSRFCWVISAFRFTQHPPNHVFLPCLLVSASCAHRIVINSHSLVCGIPKFSRILILYIYHSFVSNYHVRSFMSSIQRCAFTIVISASSFYYFHSRRPTQVQWSPFCTPPNCVLLHYVTQLRPTRTPIDPLWTLKSAPHECRYCALMYSVVSSFLHPHYPVHSLASSPS